MKLNLLLVIALAFIFSGCKKENNCSSDIQLTATNTTPTVGESFTLTANRVSGNDLFHWSGPGNFSGAFDNTITVNNAGYLDRGWYYCSKSNTECNETIYDSIFIDMKLRQGTAPCTATNNTLTGSAIPNTSFSSVIKNFDPTFNGKVLYGSSSIGYPTDFRVLFNSNNGNIEPLDGIYTTKNSIIFGQTDPYLWVSLSFVYGGQFFHCHPDKDLFVSHVNGKLSATFCNVPFSNGTTIINLSGKLTEQ
ncbi:hypothetical protein [Ferruginibacter sp.]|nr:hypothetical protein [Ferruginibacter sp.]